MSWWRVGSVPLLLGGFYQVIEIWNLRKWSQTFLIWIGMERPADLPDRRDVGFSPAGAAVGGRRCEKIFLGPWSKLGDGFDQPCAGPVGW